MEQDNQWPKSDWAWEVQHGEDQDRQAGEEGWAGGADDICDERHEWKERGKDYRSEWPIYGEYPCQTNDTGQSLRLN